MGEKETANQVLDKACKLSQFYRIDPTQEGHSEEEVSENLAALLLGEADPGQKSPRKIPQAEAVDTITSVIGQDPDQFPGDASLSGRVRKNRYMNRLVEEPGFNRSPEHQSFVKQCLKDEQERFQESEKRVEKQIAEYQKDNPEDVSFINYGSWQQKKKKGPKSQDRLAQLFKEGVNWTLTSGMAQSVFSGNMGQILNTAHTLWYARSKAKFPIPRFVLYPMLGLKMKEKDVLAGLMFLGGLITKGVSAATNLVKKVSGEVRFVQDKKDFMVSQVVGDLVSGSTDEKRLEESLEFLEKLGKEEEKNHNVGSRIENAVTSLKAYQDVEKLSPEEMQRMICQEPQQLGDTVKKMRTELASQRTREKAEGEKVLPQPKKEAVEKNLLS